MFSFALTPAATPLWIPAFAGMTFFYGVLICTGTRLPPLDSGFRRNDVVCGVSFVPASAPTPLWMDVPSRKRPAFAGMTLIAVSSFATTPNNVRSGWTSAPLDSGFRRNDVVFSVPSKERGYRGCFFDGLEVGFFAGYLDASEDYEAGY